MQVEALKIFTDVARLRSFSRGAAANRVTQSTASQTVHQLEKHLGVTLIERAHRPLRLTAEGKVFLDGCRDIVHRYQDLEQAVRRAQINGNAVVRVAAIYSVGLANMSRYVRRFAVSHPHTRVELEYLHPDRVYERVRSDAVDFGIVSFPQGGRDLVVIPWREEPMVLVCGPDHPLAGHAAIEPARLAGMPFVGFDEHLTIRHKVDAFLRRHRVTVAVALQFDNIEAIKRAVEAGSGISILPAPTLARETASGSLVAVPLVGSGPAEGSNGAFVRPLGMIHRRGRVFYPHTKEFLALLRDKAPPTIQRKGA